MAIMPSTIIIIVDGIIAMHIPKQFIIVDGIIAMHTLAVYNC